MPEAYWFGALLNAALILGFILGFLLGGIASHDPSRRRR